jgi:hypothetical protein
MKIIIAIICILIIQICNVHSKTDNEHEKRIEFIKQCLVNKDNLVEFIKNSDYYNEDWFEKGISLNNYIEQIGYILKKYSPNEFIFTGYNVRFIKILNKYLYEYQVKITDKNGIKFSFLVSNKDNCLVEILNAFIGDLETTNKFLFVSRLIQSFNNNSDSVLMEKYFISDKKIISSDKYENFKLHESDFKSLKEIIKKNYKDEIEMIHDLSGWVFATTGTYFYHEIYIKITEKCILKFDYRYDEKKNLWYYYRYELVDSYP